MRAWLETGRTVARDGRKYRFHNGVRYRADECPRHERKRLGISPRQQRKMRRLARLATH